MPPAGPSLPDKWRSPNRCIDGDVLVRVTADTFALSLSLVIEEAQIDYIFDTISKVMKKPS